MNSVNEYILEHHGILGQHWGKKNGPPYPLNPVNRSNEQKLKNGSKYTKSGMENHKNASLGLSDLTKSIKSAASSAKSSGSGGSGGSGGAGGSSWIKDYRTNMDKELDSNPNFSFENIDDFKSYMSEHGTDMSNISDEELKGMYKRAQQALTAYKVLRGKEKETSSEKKSGSGKGGSGKGGSGKGGSGKGSGEKTEEEKEEEKTEEEKTVKDLDINSEEWKSFKDSFFKAFTKYEQKLANSDEESKPVRTKEDFINRLKKFNLYSSDEKDKEKSMFTDEQLEDLWKDFKKRYLEDIDDSESETNQNENSNSNNMNKEREIERKNELQHARLGYDYLKYNLSRMTEEKMLEHHGILGQHWGKRNGPPYPLSPANRSAEQKRKNGDKYTKSGKSRYGDSAPVQGGGSVSDEEDSEEEAKKKLEELKRLAKEMGVDLGNEYKDLDSLIAHYKLGGLNGGFLKELASGLENDVALAAIKMELGKLQVERQMKDKGVSEDVTRKEILKNPEFSSGSQMLTQMKNGTYKKDQTEKNNEPFKSREKRYVDNPGISVERKKSTNTLTNVSNDIKKEVINQISNKNSKLKSSVDHITNQKDKEGHLLNPYYYNRLSSASKKVQEKYNISIFKDVPFKDVIVGSQSSPNRSIFYEYNTGLAKQLEKSGAAKRMSEKDFNDYIAAVKECEQVESSFEKYKMIEDLEELKNKYIKHSEAYDLYHHGILGQHWGKRNGPPYPLSRSGGWTAAERRKNKLAKQKEKRKDKLDRLKYKTAKAKAKADLYDARKEKAGAKAEMRMAKTDAVASQKEKIAAIFTLNLRKAQKLARNNEYSVLNKKNQNKNGNNNSNNNNQSNNATNVQTGREFVTGLVKDLGPMVALGTNAMKMIQTFDSTKKIFSDKGSGSSKSNNSSNSSSISNSDMSKAFIDVFNDFWGNKNGSSSSNNKSSLDRDLDNMFDDIWDEMKTQEPSLDTILDQSFDEIWDELKK